LIITGNAAAPVWEVLRNAQGQITQVRHRKTWPWTEVFQKFIDRTRAPLDLKTIKTIFGGQHRHHNRTRTGRRPPEIAKSVQTSGYNLTVFKLKWGNLTLKIYDKGERVLRIEVVVHNAKVLRCGRMLEKLPVLLERMNDMLVRFLDAVQASHISFIDDGTFEAWHEPTLRGVRRLAGIDVNKTRNRYVLDAVVALSTRPDGFTLRDLAAAVRTRSDWSVALYSTRHAAYDVAKLRGKSLVHPIEHSRRYRAGPTGVRAMCAYIILRDKAIKPLLAGAARPLARAPEIISPLDQHYMALRHEMHRTFEIIGLAA
jgi:hypothetical protein